MDILKNNQFKFNAFRFVATTNNARNSTFQDTDNRISREAFNSINQEYFEQLVQNIFISYRNQFINENHLLNRTKRAGLLWTYPNSIFFATTVITTIG